MGVDYSFLSKLFVLTCVWWGCSAWNAVTAKRVMRSPGGNACVAITSAASNVLGVAILLVLYSVQSKIPVIKSQLSRSQDIWFMSLAHGVGLYAAYRGLVGAKVSLVQAVKALEPLIAMGLSVMFLRKYPTTKSLAAAFVVVTGVIIVSVESVDYTVKALVWVLISSFTTQGRNLLMKIQQQKREEGERHRSDDNSESEMVPLDTPNDTEAPLQPGKKDDGEAKPLNLTQGSGDTDHRNKAGEGEKGGKAVSENYDAVSPALKGLLVFVVTSAGALPVNLLMIPVEIKLVGGFDNSATGAMCKPGPVLTAGCTHFLYNLASFGVLSFLTPPTHSLANTAKRAVVVTSAAIFLKDSLTKKGIGGLCLVIVGSGLYSYFAKNPKAVLSTQMAFLLITGFFVVVSMIVVDSNTTAASAVG